MQTIYSTIACNLDNDVLLASLPLFEDEKVEAIEWSFDALFKHRNIPDWFTELLKAYSEEKRLIGHGVHFSLFSGRWSTDQQRWLDHLKKVSSFFHFDHITEHFGFMTGEDFHKGAPMSIPFTKTTLEIGRDRLKRMQQICLCPVGIENLAFAYSADEVKRHGYFLEALVEPINGFIILDLHNVYCQMMNFDLDADELLSLYPLHLVREIHISGGSWEDSSILPAKRIRRDTHDDAVPEEVFQLLKDTIKKCPNIKYVVFEQLGNGLQSEESRAIFRNDFMRMDEIVKSSHQSESDGPNKFLPTGAFDISEHPVEDAELSFQQSELTRLLEISVDYTDLKNKMDRSSLSHSSWNIEAWDPYMVETAMKIAQKWKNGIT